jgi:ribosomal protein S18 acetylase RimI-like enzyme
MTEADIPAVIVLQGRAFPGMPTWSASQLASHLRVFPEGQLVAEDRDGRIVGSASSLVILWDDYEDLAPWRVITANGTFETHNPRGFTLYGADIGVDPDTRKRGVGRALYEARKALVRRLNLKRMITGGRIPGYAAVAHEVAPAHYVADVVAGVRHDPVLSFQLAIGFQVHGLIPGYLGGDADSLGHASLLVWLNPAFVDCASIA